LFLISIFDKITVSERVFPMGIETHIKEHPKFLTMDEKAPTQIGWRAAEYIE